MKLAPEEQEKLNKIMKKEFFVQDFNYGDIEGEMLWK